MTGPRRCYTLDDVDDEVERQRKLVERGWMRRLGGAGYHGVSVEWTACEARGVECWAWIGGGTYYGGFWVRENAADEAFEKAKMEWARNRKSEP
jgi:hypothetical protein